MMELNELDLYALRTVVEQNGGVWVGVQEGFPEDGIEPLVLFNDAKARHGSTMALKVTQCTAERVRQKLRSKAREFKRG